MNQITNGKLYQAGSGDDAISLLHIWGNTPEEFGTAYGTLMGPVIATTLTAMYQDIETQVMQSLDKIPEDMRDFVAKYGLAAALDLTRDLTKPWWPWYFEPEMLALSEAASVDFDMVVRIHMLPELVQAGCSMFGAWGKATPTGNLLQLRSLDWYCEIYHTFQSSDTLFFLGLWSMASRTTPSLRSTTLLTPPLVMRLPT